MSRPPAILRRWFVSSRNPSLRSRLLAESKHRLRRLRRSIAAAESSSAGSLKEFMDIVLPLMQLDPVRQLSGFRHHGCTTRLDHSLEVAWHSYIAAKKLRLDHSAAVRGAILHDLFLYDRRTDNPRFHSRRHPKTALNNALEVAELSDKEQDIIKRHMWPLTFTPPRYPESWIVCVADTCCATKDFVTLMRNLTRSKKGALYEYEKIHRSEDAGHARPGLAGRHL